MYFAALNGHTETVLALINHGANVNALTTNNITPLHWAALNGHTEIARALINKGADVNALTTKNATPLHAAAFNGHTKTARVLINAGANLAIKTISDETALDLARRANHVPMVAYLESVPGLSEELHRTVQDHKPLSAKRWIERGASPIFSDGTSIFDHIIGDYAPVPTYADESTKCFVKHFGQSFCNGQGQSALHIAVQHNNSRIVEYLLRNRAMVNKRDASGNTPLHYATSPNIRNKLLSHGADVSLINYSGKTAISAQPSTWINMFANANI